MPRELIVTAPRTPALRKYDELPLKPEEVRIQTEFASPKHGTELLAYRNEPAARRQYDRELGAVMPIDPAAQSTFPMPLGNMAVGSITETGPEATRFRVGDRVFGHWPIRETHTVRQDLIDPVPAGLSDEAAVCLDPAVMAFPIRDSGISLGDRVAIFGMGAIGLFAVQFARIAGAAQVIAVDPIANRRELARELGADVAMDPGETGDPGLAIRELTRPSMATEVPDVLRTGGHVIGGFRDRPTQLTGLGVDVAVEASGNIRALHQAIRAVRYGGTVCVLSYYSGDSAGLYLGEEFHINRLQLVSARAVSLPLRDAPGWNLARLVQTTLDWLVSGRLRADGVITPIVTFEQAPEAYREIDTHPERSIKLGIRFT